MPRLRLTLVDQDPKSFKPDDWDEREMIDDPEDKKPDGYDDIPKQVSAHATQHPHLNSASTLCPALTLCSKAVVAMLHTDMRHTFVTMSEPCIASCATRLVRC